MSTALKSKMFERQLFAAPYANSVVAKRGMEMVDLKALGLIAPIAGGARGYNGAADILTQTADGRDLNEFWNEFQATVAIQNAERQTLIDLLTFSVSNPVEDVAQFGSADFEEASEYGVPQGARPTQNVFSLGYTFKWYDLAARFTWQFLADASSAQVEAVHQSVLEADNRLIFMEVMRTLFRSSNRSANIKGQPYNVYAFYNGDGTAPPTYKNNTFDGTHTHYRISGAATVASGDLDEIVDDFKSHGYSSANGTTQILLVNTAEANVIRSFRTATGARSDFIPAQGQPGLIIPAQDQLLGAGQVAANYRGMNVIGSYDQLLVVEEDYVPAGYLVALSSGGRANLQNPIGLREHANPGMRGLRLVKGRDADYPLIDSYYARGFGTGIRQRGAGLVMQIKASGSYTAPAAYTA